MAEVRTLLFFNDLLSEPTESVRKVREKLDIPLEVMPFSKVTNDALSKYKAIVFFNYFDDIIYIFSGKAGIVYSSEIALRFKKYKINCVLFDSYEKPPDRWNIGFATRIFDANKLQKLIESILVLRRV